VLGSHFTIDSIRRRIIGSDGEGFSSKNNSGKDKETNQRERERERVKIPLV